MSETSDFIQPLGMSHSPANAAQLIKRTFSEGNLDQYKRELVKNALQAGAENVLVTGVRLPDFGKNGGVKFAVVDDGTGMAPNQIVDYIGELFNGASAIGPDGNFQMGARVSTLPLNPLGILVASWTEGDVLGSILMIGYNEEAAQYEIVGWPDEDGVLSTTGIPARYLRHPVIQRAGHGTVFVMLGSKPEDHTVGPISRNPLNGDFVYPTMRNRREDFFYYNSKFWDYPIKSGPKVMWGPTELSEWKKAIEPGEFFDAAVKRSHNSAGPKFSYRHAPGIASRIGLVGQEEDSFSGDLMVSSKTGRKATVRWVLFPKQHFARGTDRGGGESDTWDYGVPLGTFGELFQGEVYNLRQFGFTRRPMEHYGIFRREVRDRLILVVEPKTAIPSSSRKHLLLDNDELPHDEWGEDFARRMPEPIRKRLAELNGEETESERLEESRLITELSTFFRRARKDPRGAELLPVGPSGQGGRSQSKESAPRTGREEPATEETEERQRRPLPVGGSGHTREMGAADTIRNSKMRPIATVWGAKDAFDDTPAVVRYSPSSRELYVNETHPVVQELLHDVVSERAASKSDEIRRIAQNVISSNLKATIHAVELYQTSASMQPEGIAGVGDSYVKAALSDEALSSQLLNIVGMKAMIDRAMRGRTGFGKVTAKE